MASISISKHYSCVQSYVNPGLPALLPLSSNVRTVVVLLLLNKQEPPFVRLGLLLQSLWPREPIARARDGANRRRTPTAPNDLTLSTQVAWIDGLFAGNAPSWHNTWAAAQIEG